MSDGEDSHRGALTTEEAFGLIENEVRQAILLALSDVDSEGLNTPILSFSELRSRIDADVNTSLFNYHLQQLLGHFVERREGTSAYPSDVLDEKEGYALRPEGLLLVWTLRSSTTAVDPDLDPFDAGFDCHHCDERVQAAYRNAVFLVECPGCDYHYEFNPTPPGVVHGTDDHDEILERVAGYNRTVRGGVARGVCPLCANRLDHRFVDAAATNYPRRDLREAFVHFSCGHCGFIDYLTVGELLLQSPAVVAFALRHGVDVLTAPIWELEFASTDVAVTVAGTDPWEVHFTPSLEGETLEVIVDESLETTEPSQEQNGG